MTRPQPTVAVAVALVAFTTVMARATLRPAPSAQAPGELTPPLSLEETGLYVEGQPGVVDPRNRSYVPQYPLWSDGLTKARWVYLPPDATIDATDDNDWNLPVGTRFWKEFSHAGQKVETRLLWKATEDRWVFASYVWNDQQTQASLAPEAGMPALVEVATGKRHRIPSRVECAACHGSRAPSALGFNVLQLSSDRDPNAIHGEPLREGMLTLATLLGEGRLVPARPDLASNPPRIRTERPQTRAVLGYLATNCGICHSRGDDMTARWPSLDVRSLIEDGDAVARSLIGRPSSWQIPRATTPSVLVDGGAPERSALFHRMRSRQPSSQMPPLGTLVRDGAAIEAVARWIAVDLARADAQFTGGTAR